MSAAGITPVGMPKWGLAMTEGKVASWLVAEGAKVDAGDEIVEIETSKITNVFESPAAGILRRHVAAEGETLPVGALLGVLADASVGDADIDAYVAQARARQAEAVHAPPPPEPALTPAAGWNVRALRIGPEHAAGAAATPLLLIHGFGGDLLSWQMNQADWAADRPVIAIDLPGHGGSSKSVPNPDLPGLAGMVAAAMDALELSRAHLAGHSLGGAIALQVALDHSERVASVTLVCSAGLGPEINQGYIDGFVAADKRRELKAVIEALFADPALVTREMVDDLLRYKRLDGVAEALRGIGGAAFAGGRQVHVLADRLSSLRMPVQVIWGAADRIIPAAHAGAFDADRRHVIAGAGHMVHIEKADEVNRLMRAFLAAA